MARFHALAIPHFVALLGSLQACLLAIPLDEYSKGSSTRPDPIEDASADAAETGARCPSGATFCDDFEHDLAASTWDFSKQEEGTLAISSERYTSPSRSLRMKVSGGAEQAAPFLFKRFDDVSNEVVVDFDIYLETVGANSVGTFGQLTSASGANDVDLSLSVFNGSTSFGAKVNGGAGSKDYSLKRPLVHKTWEHVNIRLRSKDSKVNVRFGDDLVLAEAETPPMPPGAFNVLCGSSFISVSSDTSRTEPWVVYFDNYAVTIVP